MANPYQSVGDYLQFIRDKYNVQICVKDFGGFIHINKDLSEALDPFLAHTNPFCLYMKSEPERFHVCLSMIRKMHDKLLRTKKPFFGVCHAGLGEYVVPVYSGDLLLGTVNAGFFQTNEARTRWCIAHACRCSEGLETERALELYAANIATPTIPVDDLLVELQLVAGHGLYGWGLCRLQPVGWPVPVAVAAGALGVLALSRLPGMRFGRLLPMAAVYAAFVSAFLGKGFQLAAGLGQPWCFLVLAGAALFWVSDLLILFLYFYRAPHPAVHAANLATYYYGTFLVAISLGF